MTSLSVSDVFFSAIASKSSAWMRRCSYTAFGGSRKVLFIRVLLVLPNVPSNRSKPEHHKLEAVTTANCLIIATLGTNSFLLVKAGLFQSWHWSWLFLISSLAAAWLYQNLLTYRWYWGCLKIHWMCCETGKGEQPAAPMITCMAHKPCQACFHVTLLAVAQCHQVCGTWCL